MQLVTKGSLNYASTIFNHDRKAQKSKQRKQRRIKLNEMQFETLGNSEPFTVDDPQQMEIFSIQSWKLNEDSRKQKKRCRIILSTHEADRRNESELFGG